MRLLADHLTDTTCLWMSCIQLAADAQSVVAMRVLGFGGAWSMPRSEAGVMVTEKLPAFTEAYVSGMISAWSGDRPEQIGRITLAPLTDKTRRNRERLSELGPRLPQTVFASKYQD